jgi:hypothetical protein
MNRKKEKNEFHLTVGTSSILMIFVVLCLTTFGVLSFVTANADYKLSNKNAEAVTAYYQADSKANELLKTIDSELLLARESAKYCETGTDSGKIPNAEQYRQEDEFLQVTALLKQTDKTPGQKAEEAYRYFVYLLFSGRKDITIEKPDFKADSEIKLHYTVPVSDSQQLEVTVAVNKYGDKTRCKIIGHKLTGTLTTGTESHIQVWNGE